MTDFITKTELDGCVIITPPRFGDARGFFSETYNAARLKEHGIAIDFVQDNHSMSAAVGTLRGLHYQSPPHAQDKLVRVSAGAVIDVAVDARQGSPSFGVHVAVELTAENGRQLLIPKGFLHGFVTTMPNTEFLYKVSDYYAPECDGSVRFDDEELNVDWGVDLGAVVLSGKDEVAPRFNDWDNPFYYGENC